MALVALALLAALVGGWSSWIHSPAGRLVWDGALWHWDLPDLSPADDQCTVQVIVDLQFAAMLRLAQTGASPVWLWVERSQMPERWLDLRRAVYAPVRPAQTPNDATGAEVCEP